MLNTKTIANYNTTFYGEEITIAASGKVSTTITGSIPDGYIISGLWGFSSGSSQVVVSSVSVGSAGYTDMTLYNTGSTSITVTPWSRVGYIKTNLAD